MTPSALRAHVRSHNELPKPELRAERSLQDCVRSSRHTSNRTDTDIQCVHNI